jgi:thymidine kinase
MEYKGYILTEEQYNYVTYPERNNTKLSACAGSGKTQVIVLRNIFLLENNFYKSDEIYLLVFGRLARDDIINRVKLVDKLNLINHEYISTIDALSKYIIDSNNKIDVSLLSFKFMEYLENSDIKTLQENDKLNKIKCIFIDEAQDLNEIQYNILINLKNKLNITLHFIGDCNQNIFQFRDSDSKYFMNFQAKEFLLTTNFRSHREIIEFSKNLRSDQTHQIISAKGNINKKPIFHIGNTQENILKILAELIDNNIELSDIAILSPVKGRIGINYSSGLCMIANLLTSYNIKFTQFYDESKEESNPNMKFEPVLEHIALMTIFGSKGLQWKNIILIGAKPSLINYYNFTEQQHYDERNLLYVGTTRAIESLDIIVEENKKSMSINHWFQEIESEHYQLNSENFTELKFPLMKYNTENLIDNRITKIIDNFPIRVLNDIANLINYENLERNTERLYDSDFTKVEYVSPIFLGKFIESYFINCLNLKYNKPLRTYNDIKNLVSDKNIIECENQQTYDWINKNRSNVTWDKIKDYENKVSSKIYNDLLIMKLKYKKFNISFDNYTFILNNEYYQRFVKNNLDYIKKNYNKYIKCVDIKKLRKLIFICEVFHHALSTQHYYHIDNHGEKFNSILIRYADLLTEIENYVNENDFDYDVNNQYIENYNLIGEIDLIDKHNELWEIKVVQDINLKHILQLLMYNIMMNIREEYKLNFFNFSRGEKIIININLSTENINKLIEFFQTYSSSK